MHIRIFWTAALIASLAGPAFAQKPMPRYGDMGKEKTWSEKEEEKASERAYRRSLGNVPEKGPADPWGNTRSLEAPKASAKGEAKAAPAKPKAKAAGTEN